jgi:type I restriction enzyme, S subunit
MSSEWASRSLGEFVRLQRGHDLTASEQRAGTFPVMGSAGPNGSHSHALAKGPGVVIGRSGASIGRVHFSEVDYWPHNTCLYVTDFLGNDPRFAYYLLQTLNLAGYNSGSAQPSLNRNLVYSIRIEVPARREQDQIAHLLSALDDRIALLRETNATLEAIAQALFKSWFVDFDPVRAKSQGLAPAGMDEATAALFPSEFGESALGLVPKGWRQGTVSDFAHMHRASVNPGIGGDTVFEHYSLPAFDAGQMPVRQVGAEIKSNKISVPRNAVLLSKLNPHIPRVWLPVDAGPGAVCSTEFLVFVPAAGASREFAYCSLVAAPFQERLRQLVTGTSNSHQRVKPDSVATLSAVVPPEQTLGAFTSIVRPVFERVGRDRLQAQTLATLRDTLLPRLISGQLRLPQAEALVDKAA